MDYQPYINRLKREKDKQRSLASFKRKKAVQTARKISKILKTSFGAQKVYLFGSCLSEEYFHLNSDIDLAVLGLSSDNFCRALYEVNVIENGFKVDLVDLETCRIWLSQRILKEGKEL